MKIQSIITIAGFIIAIAFVLMVVVLDHSPSGLVSTGVYLWALATILSANKVKTLRRWQ